MAARGIRRQRREGVPVPPIFLFETGVVRDRLESGVHDFDAGHGVHDVFPRRHPGVDAEVSGERARLYPGVGKFLVWNHYRGGRNLRGAGRRMAGRLSAAANEKFLLPGFGGEHAAGRAGDDCRAVRPRPADAAGDRRGGVFPAAEYGSAECRGDQLGGSAHPGHRAGGKSFHHPYSRRRAFAHDDGLGGGQALAAGVVHSADHRHGDLFCHTVLWDEVCAGGGCWRTSSRLYEQHLMLIFLWISGIILALAWVSRIVDAALGMPSVADVSQPQWDRNPVSAGGNPRVSIIVPARDEEADIEQALRALLALDYDNYEVIAVNDRSTDRTGEIMEGIANCQRARTESQNPHPVAQNATRMGQPLRVIHHNELPPGWLGKTHAMWTAANLATGEWLLFTDADVLFKPESVRRALTYAEAEHADHVVMIPRVIMKRPGEYMMIAFFQIMFMFV